MKFLCILVFPLSFWLFSFFIKAETQKIVSSSNNKPLVLQWEVSHSRNTDQISLIFKQRSVELVTNTSSYQKSKVARLGRFVSPLNARLKELKEQVNQYYVQLRKTVPVSSLIKDSRFKPPVDPHAPLLRINEEKIKYGQAYFKPLANIIYKVWGHQWTCVECALYEKKEKSIVRTVKRIKSESESEPASRIKKMAEVKKQWKKSKQRFSRKLLDCVPKGKNEIECIDPQFGIFEI